MEHTIARLWIQGRHLLESVVHALGRALGLRYQDVTCGTCTNLAHFLPWKEMATDPCSS